MGYSLEAEIETWICSVIVHCSCGARFETGIVEVGCPACHLSYAINGPTVLPIVRWLAEDDVVQVKGVYPEGQLVSEEKLV